MQSIRKRLGGTSCLFFRASFLPLTLNGFIQGNIPVPHPPTVVHNAVPLAFCRYLYAEKKPVRWFLEAKTFPRSRLAEIKHFPTPDAAGRHTITKQTTRVQIGEPTTRVQRLLPIRNWSKRLLLKI